MRWHVDLRDRHPEALLALGATVITRPHHDLRSWTLADPEGNTFHARTALQRLSP
ncbi:VOC family protein [Winogradskya humida]|uniref:VOC family protein n=1 Tax=Winogradskya humida TaxID=113566 RepID=UPI0019407B3A